MVGRLFWMAGRGCEAPQRARSGWGTSRRASRGQETLPEGRELFWRVGRGQEAFLDGREWSGDPPRGLAVVQRPFQRAGRGHEALLEGQEGSEGPPGGLRGVGRPCWRAGRGWDSLPEGGSLFQSDGMGLEALSVGWEWSGGSPRETRGIGGPPRGTAGVRSFYCRARRGREAPQMAGEGREALRGDWEEFGNPSRGP